MKANTLSLNIRQQLKQNIPLSIPVSELGYITGASRAFMERNRSKLEEFSLQDISFASWQVGNSLEMVIRHELGHAIHSQLIGYFFMFVLTS